MTLALRIPARDSEIFILGNRQRLILKRMPLNPMFLHRFVRNDICQNSQ
jgi:hypothetical protein